MTGTLCMFVCVEGCECEDKQKAGFNNTGKICLPQLSLAAGLLGENL